MADKRVTGIRFTKGGSIEHVPIANILIRPYMNGKYVKGVSARSFTIDGEQGEDIHNLIFEISQVIENALREAYGVKSDC